VSNAAVRRLLSFASGRTRFPDGQLYTCSYAQLLVPMDDSAHGTAVMNGSLVAKLAAQCRAEWMICMPLVVNLQKGLR